MGLIYQLKQEIGDEEKQVGESQCFIGHEFRDKDLRVKLGRALERVGLQAYLADKEVTGDFILKKVCKRILITRASIVDLTTASPNVCFELGVAIGLNKPVFVLLKRGASVPPLLESFVKLRFTHYAGLESELAEQLPGWLEQSIEHHLRYNTHCHFVNVLCPDRQRIIPQRRYLVIDQIESTDQAGQPILTHDLDLRSELPTALGCFQFTPLFLDDVPLQADFRLCDYCRTLRYSYFGLCHLTTLASPNVYLLLGLVAGLDIPSLLMVHEERGRDGRPLFEIPTMLRGLDAFYYEHSVDIGERLGNEVEGFLNRYRGRPIGDRVLAIPELARRQIGGIAEVELPPTEVTQEILETLCRILAELLGVDEDSISLTTRLPEDLMADELDIVEFIMAVEEEYNLEITDDHVFSPDPSSDSPSVERLKLRTAQDWHDYLVTRLGEPVFTAATEGEKTDLRARLSLARDTIDSVQQAEVIARTVQALAELGDIAGVREALVIIQSIDDPTQRVKALVAVVNALAKVRDTEGIRRVVEISLTIETIEGRDEILRTTSRAYESLGEAEKARQVTSLLSEEKSIGGLTWSECRQVAQAYTLAQLPRFGAEVYTARGAIETELLRHIQDDRPTLLVVTGDPGVGKTELLRYIAQRLITEGHTVVVMYPCARLTGKPVEDLLLETMKGGVNPNAYFESLDSQWREQSARWRFVLIMDAINEHPNPANLMEQLSRMWELARQYSWFKLVLSSRSMDWDRLRGQSIIDRLDDSDAYKAFRLTDFSVLELSEAYEKYRRQYGLQTPLEQLSAEMQHLIQNPLALNTLASLYRGRPIPTEVGEALVGIGTAFYCVKCRAKRIALHPQKVTMKNGKPALKAKCPHCGTTVFRIGTAVEDNLRRQSLLALLTDFEGALGEWVDGALQSRYGQEWPTRLEVGRDKSRLTLAQLLGLVRDQRDVFKPLLAEPGAYGELVAAADRISSRRNALAHGDVPGPDVAEMHWVQGLVEWLLPMIRQAQSAFEQEMEGAGPLCPYCIGPLFGRVGDCPECGVPQHVDCWQSNEGCATPGCPAGSGRRPSMPLANVRNVPQEP